MRKRWFLAMAGLVLGPQLLRAQFIGYTSPQSVTQNLATNVLCTGAAQTFAVNNLGQTQHYLAVDGVGIQKMQAVIQGIRFGVVYNMSDTMLSGPAGGVVIASGFFPQIQVSITCSGSAGASFRAGYTGTWGTPNDDVGTFLATRISRLVLNGTPANTDVLTSFETPFGNTAGLLFVNYGGAVAGTGSVSVGCLPRTLSSSTIVMSAVLAATTSPQTFVVPAMDCPSVTVNFANSGAAGIVSIEYIFQKPGFGLGAGEATLPTLSGNGAAISTGPGNWSVTSFVGPGAQAVATKAAGTGTVRHVANCITASAGATVAPAATQMEVFLRDGASGVGTVIWAGSINAAATAAQHGDIEICGLNLVGTAGTAMTLEFAFALANENQTVTLTGYDIQ